jgi:hypothetical protein
LLGIDDVISNAARWPTMAPHDVDVRAVRVVETGGADGAGEDRRVHPLRASSAVLVGLDLDEGGLRTAGEARDRPAVRVGFFERVQRALHEELAHLVDVGLAGDVARQARPRVGAGEGEQGGGDGVRRRLRSLRHRHGPAQLGLEGVLEHAPRGEDVGVPLPALVDPGDAAVGEFLHGEQRALHVVVVDDHVRVGDGLVGDRDQGRGVTVLLEHGAQGRSEGTARGGVRHGGLGQDVSGVEGGHAGSLLRSCGERPWSTRAL